jgi:hypothetical protein
VAKAGRSHGERHQLAFVGDGHGWRPGMDTERKAPSFVIQVTSGTGSVRQFASKAVRCEARAAFELLRMSRRCLAAPGRCSEIYPNPAEETGRGDRSECDKERRH